MRKEIHTQSSARSFSLKEKKLILFARKADFVFVRERWRSGYLWGLSLFGTTSLRSVSFWATLSRNCELRRWSRLLDIEERGEVVKNWLVALRTQSVELWWIFSRWIYATATNVDAWFLDVQRLSLWLRLTLNPIVEKWNYFWLYKLYPVGKALRNKLLRHKGLLMQTSRVSQWKKTWMDENLRHRKILVDSFTSSWNKWLPWFKL